MVGNFYVVAANFGCSVGNGVVGLKLKTTKQVVVSCERIGGVEIKEFAK